MSVLYYPVVCVCVPVCANPVPTDVGGIGTKKQGQDADDFSAQESNEAVHAWQSLPNEGTVSAW